MARTRQLLDLRLDVRKRADVEGATVRHPDADLNEYINQSIADLRDQLIRARGPEFFQAVTSYPGDGFTDLFPLPALFLDLLGVKLQLGTTQKIAVEKFGELEEPEYESVPAGGSPLVVPKYRLRESNIRVLPVLSTGQTLWISYISAATRLVNDADTLDGYDGWEEFVILDAARKVATKDRMWDLVGQLRLDIQKIEVRIAALAAGRDRARPERVQDSRAARRYSRIARWRFG